MRAGALSPGRRNDGDGRESHGDSTKYAAQNRVADRLVEAGREHVRKHEIARGILIDSFDDQIDEPESGTAGRTLKSSMATPAQMSIACS